MDPQKMPAPSPADDTQTPPSTNTAAGGLPPAVLNGNGSPVSPQPSGVIRPDVPPAPGTPPAPVLAPMGPAAPGGPAAIPATPLIPAKPKKGLIVGLIIGLIVLFLGGAGAAAYFSYILPNKPENILKAGLANSLAYEDVTSEHFKGEVSVTDKASDQTFTLDYSGGMTSGGVFDVTASLDALVTNLTLDMRSPDGGSMYVRLGGLDGLPELLRSYGGEEMTVYGTLIADLNNQWIEINKSLLEQVGLNEGFKTSEADRRKMADAYLQHEFLVVKEKLADEKIAGTNSHHLKVAVDKQKLKDFFKALKDAKLDSVTISKSQSEFDSFTRALDDIDFAKYPVDVWVSKDRKLINQVQFTYSDDDGSLTLRHTTTGYDKPVKAEKPTDSKSLLEVMSLVLGGGTMDEINQLLEMGMQDSGQMEGGGISL